MRQLAILNPRRFGRLVQSDAMSVMRDPMLVVVTVMSVVPAPLLYFGRDAMDQAASATFGVAELSRYVVPIALILPAMLIGWVTGFLLLEDRDDGPLLSIDVTPIGKSGFILYRSTVTALITGAITLWAARMLLPEAGWAMTIALTLFIAAEAVLAAVVLPAVARNKVEGLALTKITNIMGIVPVLAAIPSPLRYIAGIVPTYWIGELLPLSDVATLPFGLVFALGLMSHAAAAVVLFRLLARRAG
jgi:hypothetical protein